MRRMIATTWMVLLTAATAAAQAPEAWPQRPVQIVVPYAAGTSTDSIARVIAEPLSRRLGQPVVIENRPGGSGAVGMGAVARARADGYTLGVGTSSTQTLAPSFNPNLTYDPVKDFAPVAMIGSIPYVLAASPALGTQTLADLLALARSRPGGLTYGSVGQSSLANLAALLLMDRTGIALTHVPYKSANQAAIDLMAGRLDMQFSIITATVPLIREGKMRALAIAFQKRHPALPEVPTFAEAGVAMPEIDGGSYFGVFAPEGTPDAVVRRLNAEINAIVATREAEEALARQGLTPVAMTPADIRSRIGADIEKWRAVVRKAGLDSKN